MKFFVAFFITSALLFGFNDTHSSSKVHYQPLTPSTIVDKKKIEPIGVPYVNCIVSDGTEEVDHTLEEYMQVCLDRRQWHKINIDFKGHSTTI